jgi:hypothetical protein
MKARVCRDLAEAAPTETERKYWLGRATESDEQATKLEDAIRPLIWCVATSLAMVSFDP